MALRDETVVGRLPRSRPTAATECLLAAARESKRRRRERLLGLPSPVDAGRLQAGIPLSYWLQAAGDHNLACAKVRSVGTERPFLVERRMP